MEEDVEKKYLASLDFKIDSGLKNLDLLIDKLEAISNKANEISQKMTKQLQGSIGNVTISDKQSKEMQKLNAKIELQNRKVELAALRQQNIEKEKNAQIEKDALRHSNKMEEIANRKNNAIEKLNLDAKNKMALQEKKAQDRIAKEAEEGQKSLIAQYAKTYLIYQGFNMLKKEAVETVEVMKKVEYRMVEITRVMNDATLSTNDYRDSLIDLAYDYGRSFDEVSTITLNFAKAGYNAKDSLELTKQSLLALNTAELDANQATDGLISIMAQWGLDVGTTAEKSENLAMIIDKINKTADNFPISSEGLLEALKRTSQGFNLAGASIDETIALIVSAERASQRGGKVIGTAMANITQQLKAQGKLDIAEDLGLNFYQDAAKTTFKSVTDIFAEMSEKMQELKKNGKESSTEMQSLLEIFTVFRRNIGAGLLSEMSGEDSTYIKALETSLNSIGYSAEENSKYMNTATAATEQFNASLLKLKTSIWDNQGEGLFYTLINGAEGAINVLNKMIDLFGSFPVAIGAATLAFSALSKNFKSIFGTKQIQELTNDIKILNLYMKGSSVELEDMSTGMQKYIIDTKNAQMSVKGYVGGLIKSKIATIGLTVATAALQAVISLGLSAAITAIISVVDNLIHKEEKLAEANQEVIDSTKEKIQNYKDELNTIDEILNKYEELSKEEIRTPKVNKEILSIQKQLKEILGEKADKLDLINGKYSAQKKIIDSILNSKLKEKILEAENAYNAADLNNKKGTKGLDGDWFYKFITSGDDAKTSLQILENQLESVKMKMKATNDESKKNNFQKEINEINELLSQTQKRVDDFENAKKTLNELVTLDYANENFTNNINTVDDYISSVEKINKMKLLPNFKGDIKEQQKMLKEILNNEYPELSQKIEELNSKKIEIDFKDNSKELKKNIKESLKELKGLKAEEIIEVGINGTDEQKKAYKNLIKIADEYGVSITTLINKLVELKEIQGNIIDNKYIDEMTRLKNALSDTSESFDELSKSIETYNKNGKFSSEEVKTMLKNSPELAKYLIKVGDSYKLNKQALIDYNNVQERTNLVIDEYIQKLKEEQFGSKKFAENYNEILDAISKEYNFNSVKDFSQNIKEINNEFISGKIAAKEYFDDIQKEIKNVGEISKIMKGKLENVNGVAAFGSSNEITGDAAREIEGMQALFASLTQTTVQGIEYIQAQFESGQMNFIEYSNSIEEASENLIDLYAKSDELTLNQNGQWETANGKINEYATSIQNAKDELASLGEILGTLGDNFSYISENADAFGNAAFTAADEGSAAYQQLATDMANSLNNLKNNNADAFNEIVQNMSESTGLMTNEILNSNGYIDNGLLRNSTNLNAAINSSTNQAAKATGKVTKAMGNVISALGKTIANFDYSLEGSLAGLTYKDVEIFDKKFKVPNGLKFNIKGSSRGNANDLASALQNFGNEIGNMGTPNFNFRPVGGMAPYQSVAVPNVGRGSSGSRGGSGGGSRNRSYDNAEREAEEYRKKTINLFEKIIDERERLENRWVKNKKKLGLISDKDEKYIIQESIKRYKKYVQEVDQLTMASEEEKTRLRKKYGEIAEDLEVEYFELLKDILEDEIDAIEKKYDEQAESYEKNTKDKINSINKQADAEIDALKKVDKENEKIKQKQEYEKNRHELVHGYQGVEYWEARTGREAQLALAEAKKRVEDLDKNWEETVNKWSVEDQIELIEKRRDEDIKATEAERDAYLKALEETKNAEIQALKDKYQYQLDYFNQTGQILQDNATIQAQNLFNTYKRNFIDPVGEELRKALQANASTPKAPTNNQPSNITYTIKYGDTLSGIAARYGTTIDKIMALNPSIGNKNLIYAGRQLRIPTSHTGSKILKNGLVELQAGETVLNMNWAKGLDRMLGQYNKSNSVNNNYNNGSTINVKGDLVKVEASIEDKVDAAYFSKKLTRELQNKFNVKK